MRFVYSVPRAERPMRFDSFSRSAAERFDQGKQREALDELAAAMRAASGPTADQFWLRGCMFARVGLDAASPIEAAEAYRLANEHFRDAVRCDCRFLLNYGRRLPEARWAIDSYAALAATNRDVFMRTLWALCRCTFARERALSVLRSEPFADLVAEYDVLKQIYEGALRSLEVGEGSRSEQRKDQLAQLADLLRQYEHTPHGDDAVGCADGEWAQELEFSEAMLIRRLHFGTTAERARSASILGIRCNPSADASNALQRAATDRSLQVRAQALIARARLIALDPGLRVADPRLNEDLLFALSSDRSHLVRMAASDALSAQKICPEQAILELTSLVTSSNPRFRRAKPMFVAALARYGRRSEAAVRAIVQFEPYESDENAYITKAGALVRLSDDLQMRRTCIKRLIECQRHAFPWTRRKALETIVETCGDPELSIRLLVERMYLDPHVEVRDYARRTLMKHNHQLAVQLDCYSDKS